MAGRYGELHRVADFIGRSIPRRGAGAFEDLLLHRLVSLLKAFDAVQEENAFVTLAMQTGGSLQVFYRGAPLFSLHPHNGHVRLGVRSEPATEDRNKLLEAITRQQNLFTKRIESPIGFIAQWRCDAPELSMLESFLVDLPADTAGVAIQDRTHPRNFPGEVRQAALQVFIRGGSFCRGVGRKRHKITTERVEFDHILPYAKGGASSALNVEVLCAECNRRKRDRAI